MNVLAITAYYLPGFKAGGPVRSVANLVDRLGDELSFRVITADRDLGDAHRYPGIGAERWRRVGNAEVAYLPPRARPAMRMLNYVRESRPDVIYLNSFFNHRVCLGPLLLRRCKLLRGVAVIIAPRGEFNSGAMAIRPWKKLPYLAAVRAGGLLHNVTWQATCEQERQDIARVIGDDARIVVAPNLCEVGGVNPERRAPKEAGQLRLAFLSRISPKKNLLTAIKTLGAMRANKVKLDVWGPIEDCDYWVHCLRAIERLGDHIRVSHCGPVRGEAVAATLASYDAMLLPTFGENFGHAIVESLNAGCPVVISDRTPWRNLRSRDAGWDIPLESPQEFIVALNELAAMNETEHLRLREGARRLGRQIVLDPAALAASRDMFRIAASHERGFQHRLVRRAA